MVRDITQQLIQSIEKASRVLIVPHKDFDADVFASALALKVFLKKLGKQADLYTPHELPERLLYLVEANALSPPRYLSGDFIVQVNMRERRVKELRYQREGDVLNIYLSPETEPLKGEDVSHAHAGEYYEVVVTLGCQDLESAGEVFERHPHLFFNRPVINIDRRPHNEEYAEINLVDPTRGALAELASDLIEQWKHEVLDQELATILLTGIIAGTNNFRSHSTTPHTLSQAAKLITKGANHQLIIQNLYKTKDLATLKLLGRLMSNTEYIDDVGLSWSKITGHDLREAGSTARDLTAILDEFKEQFPQPEVIAISLTNGDSQRPNARTLFYSPKQHIIELIHKKFGGEKKLDKLVVESKGESTDILKGEVTRLLQNA